MIYDYAMREAAFPDNENKIVRAPVLRSAQVPEDIR